jgi:hypothetical protein
MKVRWKRLFLWSSLGSVAVGVSVALVRRSRRPENGKPVFTQIPSGSEVIIRTEPFRIGESAALVQDRYILKPTEFKVWSVLELPVQSGSGNPEGAPIYYVTHHRSDVSPGSGPGEERVLERFYATLRSLEPGRSQLHKNQLARSTVLELPRCYVGGTSNGIESGEVHRAGAPVLDYHLESAEKSAL